MPTITIKSSSPSRENEIFIGLDAFTQGLRTVAVKLSTGSAADRAHKEQMTARLSGYGSNIRGTLTLSDKDFLEKALWRMCVAFFCLGRDATIRMAPNGSVNDTQPPMAVEIPEDSQKLTELGSLEAILKLITSKDGNSGFLELFLMAAIMRSDDSLDPIYVCGDKIVMSKWVLNIADRDTQAGMAENGQLGQLQVMDKCRENIDKFIKKICCVSYRRPPNVSKADANDNTLAGNLVFNDHIYEGCTVKKSYVIASVVQTNAEGKKTVISTIEAPFDCFISELRITNGDFICVGAPVVTLSPTAKSFDPTQISKEITDKNMRDIMDGWIDQLDALAKSQQPADSVKTGNPMQGNHHEISGIFDERNCSVDDSAVTSSDGPSSTVIVATATGLKNSIAAHLAESKPESLTIPPSSSWFTKCCSCFYQRQQEQEVPINSASNGL